MWFNWLKIASSSSPSFWMPVQASTVAENIDSLFYFIYYLCLIFFIGIIGAMVYFVFKYRKVSESQTTIDIKGSHTLEVMWSLIPGLLLLVMFAWGFRDWLNMSIPPSNTMDIRVTGQKWNWSYQYVREGLQTSELVVPAGRPVKLIMSSKDVLHSFYIPAFRIKRDVLPNRYTVAWFQSNQPGEHYVTCTEYCGTAHSTMASKVRVVSDEEYKAWVDSGGGAGGEGLSSVDFGKQLFEQKGCNACHSIDGSMKVGPSFKGLAGKSEALADGSSVQVDDNYLRDSMNEPNKHVVKGFPPVMPSFKGQLNDKQIDALIDYIKSLGQ